MRSAQALATLKLPTRLTITVAWNCDSFIAPSLAQHAAGTEDAGAVDRDVQATQEVPGGVDVGNDAGFVGDVGAEVARVRFAQFGHCGRALVVVDVEQRDLAAVRDQVPCHREAEAGDAAGDDGTGVGELHGEFLRAETRDFTETAGSDGMGAGLRSVRHG
jgi:hypothetical protein